MALQHLRSSTADKRPDPTAMADGQLAINTNATSPGLFYKDSTGALIKAGPVHVGTTAPNATPASGGTAGNSKGEGWLDTSGSNPVLKIWDGSAWQTVQPVASGTVVTTGDTGTVTSTMIADGTIVNADVNASAAIAGTKISPDFGSQNVTTTGTATGASLNPTSSTVPTNGVYLPAANTVGVATAGAGRLFVDSSGNVEIAGTGKRILGDFANATLANRLSFQSSGANLSTVVQAIPNGTATSGQFRAFNNSDPDNAGSGTLVVSPAGIALQSLTSGTGSHLPITLETGGSARLTILTDGKVGIGGTPSTDLHVTNGSGARIRAGGATGSGFEFNDANTRFDIPAANTIAAYTNNAERARIDSSGRLLVGTSSAFDATGDALIQAASSNGAFTCLGNSDTSVIANENLGLIRFFSKGGNVWEEGARIEAEADLDHGSGDKPTRLVFSTTADGASSPTERMRIRADGKVGIDGAMTGLAASTSFDATFRVGAATPTGTAMATYSYNDYKACSFIREAAGIPYERGSITVNNSSTAYNTSSDYRLKENVEPVTDGIARLQQLKPSRFNFIADPDNTVDGFIAHEVQDVVPEAIHGQKDAVDADGNPQYQGIDQSKLVPLLTAALQEAIAKIETLEARLTAAGID